MSVSALLTGAFENGGKKPVTGAYPGDGAQVGAVEKGVDLAPRQLTLAAQAVKFYPAVPHNKLRIALQDFANYPLILFLLQRAGGINGAAARRELPQRSPQNGDLPGMKFVQVFRPEPPLDLGIASEGAGSRTWHVGQDAIKSASQRQTEDVCGEYLDVT